MDMHATTGWSVGSDSEVVHILDWCVVLRVCTIESTLQLLVEVVFIVHFCVF
jgi:glycogen synthase